MQNTYKLTYKKLRGLKKDLKMKNRNRKIFKTFCKVTINILNFTLGVVRYIPSVNKEENQLLTAEFNAKVNQLREENSQYLYINHYIPLAVHQLVKTNKKLTNTSLKAVATQLLINDIAENNLDEFYRFKCSET